MPRGRPRKNQPVEAELLPPEENDQIKVREVKHTAQWVEQRPVEEAPEDDGVDLEGVEIEDKPRKKTRNAIQEMRKRLRAQGVTPASNLRLYIERYVHSETDAGGSWAETEFCTKYSTTEEHICNKDYIDTARKWGPGKYRITIRMDNRIVDAFDERISATPQTTPIIQHVNPNDPNSPQVIVQSDGQQTVMPSIKDIMKGQREALKEHLEMTKLMREAYGFAPEQSQQQPKSEEEVLTTAILKQPEVIENVVGSVLKRFGAPSGKDDEPWYADVVRDAVKSGQLVQVVQVFVDRVFNGVSNLFPGRANNGQAEISQTPLQNHQGASVDGVSIPETLPQSGESFPASADTGLQNTGMEQGVSHSPEEQALAIVLSNCSRKVPAQITADQVLKYADLLNDQAPQYSIDGYLEMFAKMPVEAALEFVKTQPNGEQVASLEWAKDYTEQLQKLIRESMQEGEG